MTEEEEAPSLLQFLEQFLGVPLEPWQAEVLSALETQPLQPEIPIQQRLQTWSTTSPSLGPVEVKVGPAGWMDSLEEPETS